jgi:hypothetical protein
MIMSMILVIGLVVGSSGSSSSSSSLMCFGNEKKASKGRVSSSSIGKCLINHK